jgi:multidrug efflux pump
MIDNFLEKRKLILTFLFFFIFFGLQKYISLPKESDPDISIPVIYVSLSHKGISPDDSERLLIKPMEKGVKKISSNSYNGGGNVILEFDAGFDADKALSDTRVKIDLTKNKLPEDSEEPVASEINLSRFPVLAIAISGNVEERVINKYANILKNKIENISEILEVQTLGDREREVEIIVNPKIVKNYGLTDQDVLNSISKSNMMIPAGALTNRTGSFNVKIPSLIENKSDLLNLPIKSNDNSVVFLKYVADIRDSFK